MKISRFLFRVSLAWVVANLVLAGSTEAATLTVTTTADSISGSLRQRIFSAAAGDTILFQIPTSDPGYDPSSGYFTILLAGESPGTKTLFIGKDLTIDGSGQKILIRRSTAAGTPLFRVFDITAGTVVISTLWVSNGNTFSGMFNMGGGAGIRN